MSVYMIIEVAVIDEDTSAEYTKRVPATVEKYA